MFLITQYPIIYELSHILFQFFLIYEEDENLSSSPTPKFDLDSSFECAV